MNTFWKTLTEERISSFDLLGIRLDIGWTYLTICIGAVIGMGLIALSRALAQV